MTQNTWEYRFANAVVTSYGIKKQEKRTEPVTHQWDRKYFIGRLYHNTCSKLRPEVICEGYEEEFVKNLYETIIANGKRLEELERAEKMRLEELVKEQALKEKELQLKFDLERFKIESGFRGSVNGHEIDILRDTGATIDLVCAKYINPSSFSGENVWVKQPLSPELVCLPLAVVEISGNFGTVQTKAAVCGNHLNQHGRYLLEIKRPS
ncbi:retrovirus-related Pol polyprotein from transposon 412 [Trichonephila clavipes]|nr:retrovirus-related Pol polyprotein from transposon 412 [Trichonephila clavipes]